MFTKINEEILSAFYEFLEPDQVWEDAEKFEDYSHDELPGYQFYPELVLFPKTTQQVSKILALANKYLFPVIPRGAGTGLSGGALPVYGGCVLSLEKMNKII